LDKVCSTIFRDERNRDGAGENILQAAENLFAAAILLCNMLKNRRLPKKCAHEFSHARQQPAR
jgi:hypothetical protein